MAHIVQVRTAHALLELIGGTDWQLVEWGFPSSGIDAVLYKAESYPTTKSVGGYVDINRMETLIQEHGGIDLQQTLKMEIEKREMLKKC